PTTGARRAASEVAADLGDFNVDIPSLETLRGPADVEATAVDLSSIGLDLSPENLGGPGAGGDANRWQEMATKLDLASAYEEIGDKEGARELLEEVVRGGDTEQQQKARAMLARIKSVPPGTFARGSLASPFLFRNPPRAAHRPDPRL